MPGQYLSDASGYEATQFDAKVPSLSDQANIVEAFKLYHYGIDNYTGSGFPAADSIHSHLETLDDRLVVLESTPDGVFTLTGTANEVNVSAASGNVVVGLPDSVTITSNLLVNNNMTVGGNLLVSGSTTFVNTSSLSVTDPIVQLATNNSGNTLDIGLSGKYVVGASTAYTGLVRDESDSTWKLFSNVSASPTTQINFTGAVYDTLKIGALDASNITSTGNITASSGTVTSANLTVTGNTDIRIPFTTSSASYTLVISDIGKIIEINNSSANTLTVPFDATLNFPTGTQLTILQTGVGQTTITPGTVGVTINGTPGLKLRTQWSSATLIKRAANTWVAIGDLVA
jgi:hypothetical protein